MSIDWTLVATVTAPIIGIAFGYWIDRWFGNRPKLIAFYGHTSAFDVVNPQSPTGGFTVHTHSIVIRNNGRVSAKNVRIGHAILPNFKIAPDINHVPVGPTDREIVIPVFVPGKQITISYLYDSTLFWHQINTYIEADEGAAKVIDVLPTPQFPKWLLRTLWSLIAIGGISVLYLLAILIRFLINL